MARDLADFTPGQGEILRRALGSKHANALLDGLHEAFVSGAVAQGVETEAAEEVFQRLRGFGSYSFPKSHAAAFAVAVYQSAWLKRYHPAEFYAAILNNQPMGFWAPSVIVSEAKRLGIRILPVDIQCSQEKCTVEAGAIRIGLSYVKGLGEASIERVVEERDRKPFKDLHDFCHQTHLPRRLVENLVLAGAMDSWGVERRQLLWQFARLHYVAEELDLVIPDDGFSLPPMLHVESLSYEQSVLGMTIGEHPIERYRDWLDAHGVLDSTALATCEHGQIIRVAGVDVMHQAPPTAKGHHFITLEDEHGMMNVIVRPKVYEKYRVVLRTSRLLIVEGEVQRKDNVVNILLARAATLP